MSEPAPESKAVYIPCTDAKVINNVQAAATLFGMKPIDVYVCEGADMKCELMIVKDKWSICYDAKLKDPLTFPFYVLVAHLSLIHKDLQPTIETSTHWLCSKLIKVPLELSHLLLSGLRDYFEIPDVHQALTVLRYLAAYNLHVEVIISRYNNVSQDYILLIHIPGLADAAAASLRTVKAPLTFTEAVVAKLQTLVPYCAEPNFSCRLDLGAKLHDFTITDTQMALVRRSL